MRGELRERGCACGGERCDLAGKFILPWALRFELHYPAFTHARADAQRAYYEAIGDIDEEDGEVDDGGEADDDADDKMALADVYGAQHIRGRAGSQGEVPSSDSGGVLQNFPRAPATPPRQVRPTSVASTGGGRGGLAQVSGDVPVDILWRAAGRRRF